MIALEQTSSWQLRVTLSPPPGLRRAEYRQSHGLNRICASSMNTRSAFLVDRAWVVVEVRDAEETDRTRACQNWDHPRHAVRRA